MDERLGQLERLARYRYETGDPGHDWTHVERVVASCQRFGGEVGADMALLIPAAMLHDLVNLAKDDPGRLEASAASAEEADGILQEAGYSGEEIEQIKSII